MRDPSKFRQRFKEYKDGKSVREIYGLPGYAEGTVGADPELDMIKKFEQWRDKTYLDSKNIPTIGWGFTDTSLVSKGKMSREEGDRYLQKIGNDAKKYLRNKLGPRIWDNLDTTTKAALLSYHHNYPAGFGDNTRFMKHWRAGRYNEAVSEIDAGMNDPTSPGLKPRRLEEQATIRKDSFLFPKIKPQEPADALIQKSDATRVAPIPTIQQQAIDYADRRNTFMAEAERQLEVKRDMQAINDMIFGQQPIYKSTYDIPTIELDQAEFKTTGHKDGKLPGYQKGLTPQQIEETIVKNQGTIQQGHHWSTLSTVANSMYRDYRKPFAQQFTEGGIGNFARGLQRQFDSLNKEARGIADVADHVNVLLDILTLAGGSVAKQSAKQAIREAKQVAKNTIKPTKTSIKKTLNATEVAEDVASKPKVKIDPKKYEQQTEYTRRITNQKTQKYNKTKLPSETPVFNSTDFPENTNISALYGPEGMLFSNKIVNNDRLMDIAVPHEFKHYLQQYYNYTPEQAMIMERAFPFSEKFIKEHPDFNFVKEGGAMLSELEYEIGKRYGFPVGKDFEDVVKHISKQEYEDMASKLSLYNRDANAERIRTGIDKSALVDALIKVPATTAPILAIDRNRQYQDGKLPGYYEGELPMGEQRQLTDEEVKQAAQNASHEQGMGGEDPLMSMLVGMKAVRLVGDQLAERRLKERAEMYKRWREANEQTRDASRAWKMQNADRMARNWGYSDNPLGFLYDIFLDPIANVYTKIQKHPILGPLIPFSDGKLPGYSNGKIRIKPANRGKFNATKKRTGKTTEELTHSKNPLTRKRAIFAQNARKWNHK